MRKFLPFLITCILLLTSMGSAQTSSAGTLQPAVAPDENAPLRQEVEQMKKAVAAMEERLAAQEKAAAAGKREIDPADYVPACVEACPTGAIRFGNLADAGDPVSQEARSPQAFRLLARIGTEPKVYYKSKESWVRALAESNPVPSSEVQHG